jgi:hypothetical protein
MLGFIFMNDREEETPLLSLHFSLVEKIPDGTELRFTKHFPIALSSA